MKNIPEGQEHKLRKALERLQTIRPSDVTELTHGWLEEILEWGVPYATTLSSNTAGELLISPSSGEDRGSVYTPPYSDAYHVRLDNDQVIWLRPSASRSPQGYKPIVVLDKQQRETKATVAALTVLEGHISNSEELRNALLLLADLSPDTLEKVWIVDRYESLFSDSFDFEVVIRELDKEVRACYELGRKPHRNADSTVTLVPLRSAFPAFLRRF